jgi:ubiquinone/menaquinone biosynthesis C-methylase UbiE
MNGFCRLRRGAFGAEQILFFINAVKLDKIFKCTLFLSTMRNNVKIMKKISNEIVSNKEIDAQGKNKTWWEKLPMTYADWEKKERIPRTKKDFVEVEKKFLDGNPYIRDKFNFKELNGKKVLEIGSGSGAASCLFAKAGAYVTAVDITKNAIKITKNNAKVQNVKINAIRQDAEKLAFKDNTFDYVFSWGVLHHSKDTQKTFSEVYRVLKKGGSGLIMIYNKNSLRYYINGLNWLILRGKLFSGYGLKSVQSFYTDGYYHRHFTPYELKKCIGKTGLAPRNIIITHMGTRFAPLLPKRFEDWLKSRFGWLLAIKFEKM